MAADGDISNKIISELSSSSSNSSNVKKLRKIVLLQLQTDLDDKVAKKKYKKAVKELEASGQISLDADGLVVLQKKKTEKKKEKKEKKSKKKRKESAEQSNEDDEDAEQESSSKRLKTESNADDEIGQEARSISPADGDSKDKNKPCKGNPSGVTRLFIGNLPFAVDEASLNDFASPAIVTHIKWITDKETGKFYGSAFVEMRDAKDAAIVVTERNGEKIMGRPIKINFAPAREGDIWPPKSKEMTGNGGQAGGSGVKAMSEKPDNCVKLFIGNLSFEIDDDTIVKFFGNVDAEVKAVRWLHHKDSGDFKGCGYAEFWNTEACEKGATLNGKTLLGRPIRIDWTD